jgi:hypothetical protein
MPVSEMIAILGLRLTRSYGLQQGCIGISHSMPVIDHPDLFLTTGFISTARSEWAAAEFQELSMYMVPDPSKTSLGSNISSTQTTNSVDADDLRADFASRNWPNGPMRALHGSRSRFPGRRRLTHLR